MLTFILFAVKACLISGLMPCISLCCIVGLIQTSANCPGFANAPINPFMASEGDISAMLENMAGSCFRHVFRLYESAP